MAHIYWEQSGTMSNNTSSLWWLESFVLQKSFLLTDQEKQNQFAATTKHDRIFT